MRTPLSLVPSLLSRLFFSRERRPQVHDDEGNEEDIRPGITAFPKKKSREESSLMSLRETLLLHHK